MPAAISLAERILQSPSARISTAGGITLALDGPRWVERLQSKLWEIAETSVAARRGRRPKPRPLKSENAGL